MDWNNVLLWASIVLLWFTVWELDSKAKALAARIEELEKIANKVNYLVVRVEILERLV
jgi:hypothetical protein